jgi:hypothetical protein
MTQYDKNHYIYPSKSDPMRKTTLSFLIILLLLLNACTTNKDGIEFVSGDFSINISENGSISSLYDLDNGREHLLSDSVSSLIRMRFDGKMLQPQSVV